MNKLLNLSELCKMRVKLLASQGDIVKTSSLVFICMPGLGLGLSESGMNRVCSGPQRAQARGLGSTEIGGRVGVRNQLCGAAGI